MMCPENFLLSWLYVFGNVVFTLAIGMFGGWMISKFIAYVIAEHRKYQPSPYLVMMGTFLTSQGVGSNLIQIGSDWWKNRGNSEVEKLKTQIADLEKQLKEKDEPLRKLFKIVTPILAKAIVSVLGFDLPAATRMVENFLKPEMVEKIVESGMIEKYADTFLSTLSKPTQVPDISELLRSRRKPSQEAPDFTGIFARKKAAELSNVIKSILTRIIDDSIGASNLKERIELKSKLMGIIEGFEHVNKLIVSEPEAIKCILNKILDNTLAEVRIEMKNDPTLREKWDGFKIAHDKSFCIKDLPVGAIYNVVDRLKANLMK